MNERNNASTFNNRNGLPKADAFINLEMHLPEAAQKATNRETEKITKGAALYHSGSLIDRSLVNAARAAKAAGKAELTFTFTGTIRLVEDNSQMPDYDLTSHLGIDDSIDPTISHTPAANEPVESAEDRELREMLEAETNQKQQQA